MQDKEKWTSEDFKNFFANKPKPTRKNWNNIAQKLEEEGRAKRSKTKGRPKLEIKYARFEFTGISFNLNKAIAAAKKSPFKYAKLKADQENIIIQQAQNLPAIDFPGKYKYTIYSKNRRQDGGNMLGVSKIVEDALQQAGVIENDGQMEILSHEFIYEVDKNNPRVVLEIIGI